LTSVTLAALDLGALSQFSTASVALGLRNVCIRTLLSTGIGARAVARSVRIKESVHECGLVHPWLLVASVRGLLRCGGPVPLSMAPGHMHLLLSTHVPDTAGTDNEAPRVHARADHALAQSNDVADHILFTTCAQHCVGFMHGGEVFFESAAAESTHHNKHCHEAQAVHEGAPNTPHHMIFKIPCLKATPNREIVETVLSRICIQNLIDTPKMRDYIRQICIAHGAHVSTTRGGNHATMPPHNARSALANTLCFIVIRDTSPAGLGLQVTTDATATVTVRHTLVYPFSAHELIACILNVVEATGARVRRDTLYSDSESPT
jgi:hypothetical protein